MGKHQEAVESQFQDTLLTFSICFTPISISMKVRLSLISKGDKNRILCILFLDFILTDPSLQVEGHLLQYYNRFL